MSGSRVLLAFALLACGACSKAPQKPADESPALTALLERCRAAVKAAPKDAHARAELALALEANERWAEAAEDYEEAAELEPKEALWALHAAICQAEAGDAKRARKTLAAAAEEFPDCAPILQRHGLALLDGGDTKGAEAVFRQLVELQPGVGDAYVGLAEVFLATKSWEAALKTADYALMTDADSPAAHHVRGRALEGLGRADESGAELAWAATLERGMLPDRWSARKPELALGFEARFERAVKLVAEHEDAEALPLFEELARERPGDVKTHQSLALVKASRGDVDGALAVCDGALSRTPTSASLHATRARVLLSAERPKDAALSARRATELEPRTASHFELLGLSLATAGDDAGALSAWKKSLELDPSNVRLRGVIGELERR